VDDQSIRDLIRLGRYEFSKHAEREREADEISMAEFEEALAHCGTIEDYPNDPRGSSLLVLGFSGERPIHAVCALRTDPLEVLIITVYDPSKRPDNWEENYRKRKD
jgi:hypothetical protein